MKKLNGIRKLTSRNQAYPEFKYQIRPDRLNIPWHDLYAWMRENWGIRMSVIGEEWFYHRRSIGFRQYEHLFYLKGDVELTQFLLKWSP